VIISVSCSNLLTIFYGLLCLEKCYHDSALRYEVYHQGKIILFSVALIFITGINLHVNGSRKFGCFLLHNFQVGHASHGISSTYSEQFSGKLPYSFLLNI
jgi:hypothetical protein